MTLRTLALMLVVAAGIADAAPKAPAPPSNKPSKKQLDIERHEWMAQYYLRRANDLTGAAKEYQAILAIDPENASAGLALASIYARDKKEKLAIDVLTKLTKKNPKNDEAWLVLANLQ